MVTMDMASKAQRKGARKQQHLKTHAKVCFMMVNELMRLATANLVEGLEGVMARDMPEPHK